MPRLLRTGELASLLRPGMRVFVQGSSSEPTALVEDLLQTPDASAGIEFVSCQIPGLNRIDFAGLHDTAQFRGLFVTPETAQSHRAGKVRFMPISYSSMYRYLETLHVDIALVQVTPAEPYGAFSLGTSVHFVPAILEKAGLVIAEINEALPAVGQSVAVSEGELDVVLPTAHSLPTLDPGPASETSRRIGAHVASLVRDGDHIQIGIGKVPNAVLDALCAHRGLVCHGGLISDGMIALSENGALDPSKPMICTSVLGTKNIYDWVRGRSDVHVVPVKHTHDIRVMAALERFVAINSVLAVDLHGQANAETVDGRQAGGSGGLPDFVRGAHLSKDGRSILVLPSTAAGGTISRIVPALDVDIASCPRCDADYVVTEHGIAELRHKSLEERAQALIAIADPSFQSSLSDGWQRPRD
ncbi:MAG: acetyl-CoA hydrolase/transferase C-terminal domain-containing protein [Alphaproteobacteria bacterium]